MAPIATVPPFVNRAMKMVLRSPMHGIVSKTVLLITFTGRKSGTTFTTPVSYSQVNDQVRIFTHAAWWKNLQEGALVSLRIRGRELKGMAQAVSGDQLAVACELAAHLKQVPSDARYYDVTFDENGNPRENEVAKAVETVVMIRVQLC